MIVSTTVFELSVRDITLLSLTLVSLDDTEKEKIAVKYEYVL